MTSEPPVLTARSISKSFGSHAALSDVSFSLRAGEVVALLGDNGAGKSTLVKTISGVLSPSQGSLFFAGHEAALREPRDAARYGVATVYQDLALCDNLDVVQNLFLGREVTRAGALQVLDEEAMEARARQLLAQLDVRIADVRSQVQGLSGGQRQCIAVARAVLADARLVMLDEPTAALGVVQTEQVLNLIRKLRSEGLAVLLISHNLADVFQVADRILVLRLGRLVGDLNARECTREQVVGLMTGALLPEGPES